MILKYRSIYTPKDDKLYDDDGENYVKADDFDDICDGNHSTDHNGDN